MTHQPIAFELERAVPADDALKDLLPGPLENALGDAPAPAPRQKFNFRKMLMTGAAAAVLAGAVWYGWDYWTVGQYLVSTDDTYVKADNTTIAPKVSGYLREVLVGDNERVAPGRCWPGSTSATSRWRSIRRGPMSQRPRPRSSASRPSSGSSRR